MPNQTMNKTHYQHLIIYTLAFAVLLGISLWMYMSYTNPVDTKVEESGPKFSDQDIKRIDEASMQSTAKFSEKDLEVINNAGTERN